MATNATVTVKDFELLKSVQKKDDEATLEVFRGQKFIVSSVCPVGNGVRFVHPDDWTLMRAPKGPKGAGGSATPTESDK